MAQHNASRFDWSVAISEPQPTGRLVGSPRGPSPAAGQHDNAPRHPGPLSPTAMANRCSLATAATRLRPRPLPGGHQFQVTYAGPALSMRDMMMLALPEPVRLTGDIVQSGRIPGWKAQACENVRLRLARNVMA